LVIVIILVIVKFILEQYQDCDKRYYE